MTSTTAATPARRVAAVVAPLLLLLVAGGLRFARIDEPSRIGFDEKHYVPDAREYLDRGVEVDRPAHPPAGKWLMAASIAAVGDRPVGWRLVPAVSGVVAVGATYLMGWTLFRRRWAALLAGGLVALDGIALTMSRIGMLDGIQAGLVATGALFSLWDRRASHLRWRWAAGAVLGVGVAVKWSTLPVLAAAVGVAAVADLAGDRPRLSDLLRLARRVLVPLLVLPALLYVASYASWFANVDRSETGRERCPASGCSIVDAASGWAFEQWDMWDLQSRLEPTHPDRSRPLQWLTVTKPVLVYAEGCPAQPSPDDTCRVAPGQRARTLTIGNPALWWSALAAFPYMVWKVLRRRDGEAAFVAVYLLAMVIPWFATPIPGFAFYLTPVVPFVALALLVPLADIARRWRWGASAPAAVGLVAVICAVALYPVWTGLALTPEALEWRLWLESWR